MSRSDKKAAAYIRERVNEMTAVAKKSGRVTAWEQSMLRRRLNAIADEIEQGMHR